VSSEVPGSGEDAFGRLGMALHDLCQPLTTLLCRLEMAQQIGTAEAYREAVDDSVAECVRLAKAVGSMREAVRAAAGKAGNEARVGR
jgi:signal transduction histidine kinase